MPFALHRGVAACVALSCVAWEAIASPVPANEHKKQTGRAPTFNRPEKLYSPAATRKNDTELYASRYDARKQVAENERPFDHTDLEGYFDRLKSGPVVWKWRHYFKVYERHLRRFRGTDVHFAEVGIFSGGSLKMWRWYFGEKAVIYGVDLHNKSICENNENCGSPRKIFQGDQGSAEFWASFRAQVPRLDVLLDDGAHLPHLQQTTLEELYPHLSQGGVYLTEDLHGPEHPFVDFVYKTFVTSELGVNNVPRTKLGRRSVYTMSRVQHETAEIAFYHYMITIEKHANDVMRTGARIELNHGTTKKPCPSGYGTEQLPCPE